MLLIFSSLTKIPLRLSISLQNSKLLTFMKSHYYNYNMHFSNLKTTGRKLSAEM